MERVITAFAPHTRRYLYVGGEYSRQGSSAISHGQMYVEHLVPVEVTKQHPLLFIHGDGMSGTNFLNTPEGKPGWADFFMRQGYEVYIVDQPARARSPWQSTLDGNTSTFDTYMIESHFTATQYYKLWPHAELHTQWPGNGSRGDPIFDAFYRSTLPRLTSAVETSRLMKTAGSKLLDTIGKPVILFTHSQSGQFGWILADSRPNHIHSIVALEPIGPPFQNAVFGTDPARPFGLTEIPVQFSPPIQSPQDLGPLVAIDHGPNYTCLLQHSPARQLTNVSKVPVFMVTSESGYHSVYDGCTVQFLRDAGVDVLHLRLEDLGIKGNGHMMFMEKNSEEIADVVLGWISSGKVNA
ncbi:alpha beta-hydrolase [Coniophora puteana RWD-64-598 SS2]|uniref:Alpha beta-hydrolase n=1 Tax=Coniophora puteana (strain RWD-64-598) TaxID=741705 RepID=A0A5M3MTP9_CONPW|nr:alpha beta-hydrolase [Coniophora puteana RWD-64-598 SS2]EIW82460.1 alpha beta-hydrolase [Coniophora puteana RWD-64-598 SS2]